MGSTRWDDDRWSVYSTSVAATPRAAVFKSNSMDETLDPIKIVCRESVDSPSNPNSTPIIIGVDETGSMGELAEQIIKHGLGVVMKEIYDRRPISDPHILIAGIGDSVCDQAPLQVTQFEAGVDELTKQVEKIFLEANGGGNNGESYPLMWYFAAHKTKCDAIIKRNRKGYLFTVGDERFLPTISRAEIKKVFGDDVESDIKIPDLLDLVQKHWEVFHVVVETNSTRQQDAIKHWKDLLGQRVLTLPNKDALAEVIVSAIQVIEGEDPDKVAGSWDGSKAVAVRSAIKDLSRADDISGNLVRM